MTDPVRVVVEQGVMTITLNRPEKKNALTNAMYATLSEALGRADADRSVRVILLQAEGDAFTSGNDLSDFAAVASGALKREDMRSTAFLHSLARLQKPLIAAVQGLAVGVGVTLLLHCDLVFVAEDARLITPFVNLGLVPEAASSALLPARIGYARAFAMFAFGEAIDGRTAAAIGLANAATPAAQLRERAASAAIALAAKPIGALKATKALMRDSTAIMATMAREGEVFGARLKSPEAVEAFKAFAEKRAPDFSQFQE